MGRGHCKLGLSVDVETNTSYESHIFWAVHRQFTLMTLPGGIPIFTKRLPLIKSEYGTIAES